MSRTLVVTGKMGPAFSSPGAVETTVQIGTGPRVFGASRPIHDDTFTMLSDAYDEATHIHNLLNRFSN